MKSWIMLSDKELDDTQVYMKEQEGENVESMSEDREAIHYDRNAAGDSGIYSDNDGLYSDSNEEETESDIESKQNRRGRRRRLSRDEEVEQLVQEVGQEVVGADDEEGTLFHRRKRRQDKKAVPDSENTPETQEKHPEVKKVDFKEVTTEKTKKAGREQQRIKQRNSGSYGESICCRNRNCSCAYYCRFRLSESVSSETESEAKNADFRFEKGEKAGRTGFGGTGITDEERRWCCSEHR